MFLGRQMKSKVNFLKKNSSPLLALILIIPLSLTYFVWQLALDHTHNIKSTKFEALTYENERTLQHRMTSYNQSLLGGEGFYKGSNNVSRDEWKSYVKATEPLKNFPGINGIGMIEEVPKENIGSYIAKARKDSYPKFKIKPAGDHETYFIIKYIEPVDINEAAVGLNIAFEENRRDAANQARETGKATITKRILLVQDNKKITIL